MFEKRTPGVASVYPAGDLKKHIREVWKRYNHICQMCGARPGDRNWEGSGRVTLQILNMGIAHTSQPNSENLRTVCSDCAEGLQNTSLPKPERIHLLSQIRRATRDDQQEVLDWLL